MSLEGAFKELSDTFGSKAAPSGGAFGREQSWGQTVMDWLPTVFGGLGALFGFNMGSKTPLVGGKLTGLVGAIALGIALYKGSNALTGYFNDAAPRGNQPAATSQRTTLDPGAAARAATRRAMREAGLSVPEGMHNE